MFTIKMKLLLLLTAFISMNSVTNSAPMFQPSNKTDETNNYEDYDQFVLDEYPSEDYYYYNNYLNNGDKDSALSDDYLMYKSEQEDATKQKPADNNDKVLIAHSNDDDNVHEIHNSETIVIDAENFPVVEDIRKSKQANNNKPYSTGAFKDAFKNREAQSEQYSITAINNQDSRNTKRPLKQTVISDSAYFGMFIAFTISIVVLALILAIVFVVLRTRRVSKTRQIKKPSAQHSEYKTVVQTYI